jgi:hypothetical protein
MKSESRGVIKPGHLYQAAELRRQLGFGDWTWRKMRRAGLPIVYQGSRAYVLADDVIAYFERRKGDRA